MLTPSYSFSGSITRNEHGIRSRTERVAWHTSSTPGPIAVPPLAATAVDLADIYQHSHASGIQLWVCTQTRAKPGPHVSLVTDETSPEIHAQPSEPTWVVAMEGYPHPYIKGYVLHILVNNEPRWVKSETIRTYKGKEKKRGASF